MSRGGRETTVKRVSGEFQGDDAVDMEVIEATLGISRIARSKGERDDLVLKAAKSALFRTLELYRLETGEKYPDYDKFVRWLAQPETDARDARKSATATVVGDPWINTTDLAVGQPIEENVGHDQGIRHGAEQSQPDATRL